MVEDHLFKYLTIYFIDKAQMNVPATLELGLYYHLFTAWQLLTSFFVSSCEGKKKLVVLENDSPPCGHSLHKPCSGPPALHALQLPYKFVHRANINRCIKLAQISCGGSSVAMTAGSVATTEQFSAIFLSKSTHSKPEGSVSSEETRPAPCSSVVHGELLATGRNCQCILL